MLAARLKPASTVRFILRLLWGLSAAAAGAIVLVWRDLRGDAAIPIALLVALLLVIAALLALAAAMGDFTLSLPSGWKRAPDREELGRGVYAGRLERSRAAFLYTSEDGGYFSVLVDAEGGGARPDARWEARVLGDRIAFEREEPPCGWQEELGTGVSEPCPKGDGQLHVGVGYSLSLTGSGDAGRAHDYRIQFGNVKREEGVDLAPFRAMLASLRAK